MAANNEATGNGMASFRELRALWGFAKPARWEVPTIFVLGIVTSCLDGLGTSLIVLYLYAALGNVHEAADSEGLLGAVFSQALEVTGDSKLLIGAIVFSLVALSSLLRFAHGALSEAIGQRISERIRVGLHDQYLHVAYDEVRRHEPGALLNLIESAAWTVSEVTANLLNLAISAATIVVFATLLIATSWQFTLVSLVGIATLFIGVRLFGRRAALWGARAVQADNALTQCALTTLNCLRTIRIFGQEAAQKRRFDAHAGCVRDTFIHMERVAEIATPVSEIGHIALLCLFVGSAAALDISFAGSLAAVALLHRLRPHTQALEAGWLELSGAHAKLHRLREMLDRAGKRYLPPGHLPFATLRSGIRFEQVTLRYRDAALPALDQASFTIPAGATTALVGPSGAGKSTIVNLLLRLYRADSGAIWVDEQRLDELERGSWLEHTALAGQDVELMAGTLNANIRMASPQSTAADIERAAAGAALIEFVNAQPTRFDTQVGERGLSLSAGQRQRVGLARAFARDPQLLILDEAMSALDRVLEEAIRRNIERNFRDRTVLLITHRLETVLNADHIVCIEHGRVLEQGTPDELLNRPNGALKAMLHRGVTPRITASAAVQAVNS